ncbi:MAG: hypothetical protein ACRC0A_07715 [Chitinophagaceae bacterium]
MSKYEFENSILNKAIKNHDQAKVDWRKLYDLFYSTWDEPRNKFQESIIRQSSILSKLSYTPSFRQRNIDTKTINEIMALELMLSELFDENDDSISVFLQDGLISSHGVLRIIINERENKIVFSREDNLQIALYKTKDKTEYLIDRVENKMWTKNMVFYLDKDNKKIIKDEHNTLKFIPYIIFSPFRTDENNKGSNFTNYKEYFSIYGQPNFELYNLQQRYIYNRQLYSLSTNNAIKPSVLVEQSEAITQKEYDELMFGGSVIMMNNPNSGLVVKGSVTSDSMNILRMNGELINKEFAEYTGLNETTLGQTTRSISASALQEIKEGASIITTPYEKEYKKIYEEISRKVAKTFIILDTKGFLSDKDIDNLIFERYNKDLDAQEKITVLQSVMQIILQMGITPASIDLMDTTLTPLLTQIAQGVGINPALVSVQTQEAFKKMKEEIQKRQALEQQQIEQQQIEQQNNT